MQFTLRYPSEISQVEENCRRECIVQEERIRDRKRKKIYMIIKKTMAIKKISKHRNLPRAKIRRLKSTTSKYDLCYFEVSQRNQLYGSINNNSNIV